MDQHWHGYAWTGHGQDIVRDAARRPGPDSGFLSNALPPLVTAHWLLKPRNQIKGTWTDPADAVAWLLARYEETPEPGGPSLELRTELARDALPRGNDVTWAYWLGGGRFVHYSVLSCPRRTEPDVRCPAPPN